MKKIFLFAGVGVLSFVLFAGSARASVLDDLLRQANQLQEVVARLRAQIEAQRTTQPSVIVAPTIATQATTGSGGALGFVTLDELPGSPRASCEMPALSRGSRGNSVYLLQMYLKHNGNYPEGLITGFYGNLTEKAVRSLQNGFSVIRGSLTEGSVDQFTANVITADLRRYYPECGTNSVFQQPTQVITVPSTQTVISGIRMGAHITNPYPYVSGTVRAGSQYQIIWDQLPGGPTKYDLTLVGIDGKTRNIAFNDPYLSTVNNCEKGVCSYPWMVPSDRLGGQYQVLVEGGEWGKGGRVARGLSSFFTVQGVGTTSSASNFIKVISPNGGETLSTGQRVPISVTTNLCDKDISGGIGLELYKKISGETDARTPIQNIVNGWVGGSPYYWTIPTTLSAGNYYVYAVASLAGSPGQNVSDFSDNSFRIESGSVSTPTITITSNPRAGSNGNVTIKQGDKITITGVPSNLSGKMLADYTRSFFFDSVFNNSCSNTDWVITCTASQTGTSNFYITIYKDGQAYKSNVIKVTVVASTPTFTFTYPAGGESFLSDATYTVKWSTNSTASTARLTLWKGGSLVEGSVFGSSYDVSVLNIGSYN